MYRGQPKHWNRGGPTTVMEATTVAPATTMYVAAVDEEAATSRQSGQRNELPELKQRSSRHR